MVKCVKCGQVHAIAKAGKVRGEQRFFCKDCQFHFTLKKTDTSASSKRNIKSNITIQDIAKTLGISFSTVSKALRDKEDVSLATRELVQKTARKMKYRPNLIAQNLVHNRSHSIGVIAPYIGNYFFPTVINGIYETVLRAGYNLLVCLSHESAELEIASCNLLASHRVDGIIIGVASTSKNFNHIRNLQNNNIPVVFVNRAAASVKASRVTVNDYEGAVKVTEHLIEQGCKRIAHIAGPSNLLLSKLRMKGYIDTLNKYGMLVDKSLIFHTRTFMEDCQPYIDALLNLTPQPDAIFAYSDFVGLQIIKRAKQKKIRIPQDLCVIGFSNDPMSEIIEPGLSTLSQPPFEMGRAAAEIMIRHIEGKIPPSKIATRSLNFELIVRESSRKKE